MADVRASALAALREGRVTVFRADPGPIEGQAPVRVAASVESSRANGVRHIVDLDPTLGWYCTCNKGPCAHILAVRIVTGFGGGADRDYSTGSETLA